MAILKFKSTGNYPCISRWRPYMATRNPAILWIRDKSFLTLDVWYGNPKRDSNLGQSRMAVFEDCQAVWLEKKECNLVEHKIASRKIPSLLSFYAQGNSSTQWLFNENSSEERGISWNLKENNFEILGISYLNIKKTCPTWTLICNGHK